MREICIEVINRLPKLIKWILFKIEFVNRMVRLDLSRTRSKLLDKTSKIIIIGANDGLSFDDLFQSIDPLLVKGLVLEPSKKYFSLLKENLLSFKDLKLLNLAVTDSAKIIQLFQLNDSGLNKLPEWGKGLGSFSKEHLIKNSEINETDIESQEVQGIPFMSLIDEYIEFRDIDYLQIDTEGHDAEIIKSINFQYFSVKMIKFEWVNLSNCDLEYCKKILIKNNFFLTREGGDYVGVSKEINLYFK